MPNVSNLTIKVQTGTTNTLYASWEFNETVTKSANTTAGSGNIQKGSLVTINSGATYYNGTSIPSWVKSDQWYIVQVKGARAVLGKNKSGTHNIQSAINVKYLSTSGSSGGGSSSTTTTDYNKTLDHYEVKWTYATGDGIWFEGSKSDVEVTNALYNSPDNATKVKVSVKPIAKTHTVNNKETAYWTGTAKTATYETQANPPEKPPTPSVKMEKYKLTATVENVSDPRSDQIQFEVYNGTKKIQTGTVDIITCQAAYSCSVTAGGEFRVRCRSINTINSSKVYSEWTDFTSSISTIPSAPSEITTCKAQSSTAVYLEWSEVKTAKSYEIEYTTERRYFDNSDQTSTKAGIEFNHYEITGLQSGDEYFFRVRAINDNGESAWTDIVSIIIGKDPSAPTTWSSSTTVITGEPLNLYWVHNAEDGSDETYAELEMYIDGVKETRTIEKEPREDPEDKTVRTSIYEVDTSQWAEGTEIKWRVRTAGITRTYGDWSIQRTIDIYAPPTLDLDMTDIDGNSLNVLTSFPFYISGLAGPNTQRPIGYHLTITSDDTYETIDKIGNPTIVGIGDSLYSNFFDVRDPLLVEMSASNLDLEDGQNYTITCTVSMDSGLTAESTVQFSVSWSELVYEPSAEIAIDESNYSAYITPYCNDDEGNLISDVFLSVYRREYDGKFTEIATGIDGTVNTVVTDPHPSLDYARYRIVATHKTTGAVGYYDIPGYPIQCKSVIIQWDEDWTEFNSTGEDELVEPPWTGSLLKLPYNIDVSDKNSLDTVMVNYVGRSHPVSYYGTHLGETSSWNMEIDKSDIDTIYALRRLSKYMGDVYVREPSGTGYWACINVSFNIKHRATTIPVSIGITRVEGGI